MRCLLMLKLKSLFKSNLKKRKWKFIKRWRTKFVKLSKTDTRHLCSTVILLFWNRAWPWRMSDLVLNICHCYNLFLKEWSISLSSCFDYSGNQRMFFFKIILLESACYLWTSNVKYLCAWFMINDYREIFHCCRYHLQYWWKCRGLLNVLV